MRVEQIASGINEIVSEILGNEATLVNEDLSNIVEVGHSLEDFPGGVDHYVAKLPNVIGRWVFVNRVYRGYAPNIKVDGWEYGSIMAKYSGKMPEAIETEMWELRDGASYDQSIFYKPTVETKFFNGAVTFTIPQSVAREQVKESFTSAYEANAFFEMLYNEVEKAMTVRLDALAMRTITSLMAHTIADGIPDADYSQTSERAVNLLALYNAAHEDAQLTAEQALKSPEFIRFAIYVIGDYRDMMKTMSTRFNVGGQERFTPEEYMKTVLFSPFVRAAGVYLYDAAGQFRTENLGLGTFESVSAWQGLVSMDEITRSEIDVTISEDVTVNCTGILGVLFDRDAAVICNQDRKVEVAPYNAVGSFWNYYHKWKCSYRIDLNENCVVFFVHD